MNLLERFGYFRPLPRQEALWQDNPRVSYEAEEDTLTLRLAGDDSDCGGWTWDPPCGGCGRCIGMQISYGFQKARELARAYAKYDLYFAPGTIDRWPTLQEFGKAPFHDFFAHLIDPECHPPTREPKISEKSRS